MSVRPSVRVALSLLAVVLLASCGALGFRQPRVTLEGMQLGGVGFRGGTLLVDLRVQNPNAFSLNAQRLRYDLAVSDAGARGDSAYLPFASGTYDQPFSVRGGETRTIRIPVEFSWGGLGGAASSILRAGTFNYRANGTVDVDTPVGARSIPFTKRGTVTMSGQVR